MWGTVLHFCNQSRHVPTFLYVSIVLSNDTLQWTKKLDNIATLYVGMSLPGMTQQRSAQLNQGATFSRRKLSLLDVCPLLTRCGRYLHKTWTFLDNHTPRRGNFSTPTYCSINLYRPTSTAVDSCRTLFVMQRIGKSLFTFITIINTISLCLCVSVSLDLCDCLLGPFR